MNIGIIIASIVISAVIFFFIGVVYRKKIAESKIQSAEEEAKKILELANKDAENRKKEEIFKAKEEIMNARNELDKEIKERRGEIQSQEKRLFQREENIDKKSDNLEKKEKDLELRRQDLENEKLNLEKLISMQREELERISNLTSEEAKKQLLKEIDEQITNEKAILIKDKEQQFKEQADKMAKEIIGYSIQKCAADHSQETTVSIVSLPNDDMKGRIIGREGRNINWCRFNNR